MTRLRHLRLRSTMFWVDVRLRRIGRVWIASADTPGGPSLGLGRNALEALTGALEAFDGMIDELLDSIPGDAYYLR